VHIDFSLKITEESKKCEFLKNQLDSIKKQESLLKSENSHLSRLFEARKKSQNLNPEISDLKNREAKNEATINFYKEKLGEKFNELEQTSKISDPMKTLKFYENENKMLIVIFAYKKSGRNELESWIMK